MSHNNILGLFCKLLNCFLRQQQYNASTLQPNLISWIQKTQCVEYKLFVTGVGQKDQTQARKKLNTNLNFSHNNLSLQLYKKKRFISRALVLREIHGRFIMLVSWGFSNEWHTSLLHILMYILYDNNLSHSAVKTIF